VIVVDTDVISESIRRDPDPSVRAWLNRQVESTLYVTTVTVAELRSGVEMLAPGQRKNGLRAAVDEALGVFDDRVLPFDVDAAHAFAAIMTSARAPGQSVSVADGQIAATALSRGFGVASRYTGSFLVAGVDVIDPWQAG
jgi:predicted nucleic acid-binding protein